VLKWVEASALPRCREELTRERGFYRRFGQLRCVPTPLDEIDEPGRRASLLLSYHPGTTLRQWLADQRRSPGDAARVERCAAAVGSALRELFLTELAETPDRRDELRRLGRVFTVLMKSGPVDVPADPAELAGNTRLRRWAAPLAHRAFRAALQGIPLRACIAHGDLHSNNVLITPDLEALLVDFGRWEPGECVSDLGYLATLLETTLADRPAERDAFAAELERTVAAVGLPVSEFDRLLQVLRLGASVNSRLHPIGRRPVSARLRLLPRLATRAAQTILRR
jgi:hypothetical protein